MTESFCMCAQAVRRVSKLLHLLLSLGLFSVFAHSQCVAPAAGAAVPAAPSLDSPIFVGANYATGTGIPGDTVVICVEGKPTAKPTTTTIDQNGKFRVLINQSLTADQQVTAQQYAAPGGAAIVYGFLSNIVTVGEVTDCLEALSSGECQFRVTINTSAAIGNNSQTNTNTVPNIMVTLDYQKHPPQDSNSLKGAQNALNVVRVAEGKPAEDYKGLDKIPWLAIHLTGKTGFTQTFAASSVQPTPTTTGGTTPACPKNSQAPSSTNCTLAVSKPSFLAELGGKVGATTAVDNAGFYGEFGFGGRGSFQYLIPTNQIVQNNGASYIDLNAMNSHNTVGFYEATGYAAIAQHDSLTAQWKAENTLPLLIIEGGYQNNRALQQLLPASPGINTRSRYVGRFTFNYEVSHSTHSRISLGMEYSGAIHGGPPVLQLFVGGNLNPAKLFGGQ